MLEYLKSFFGKKDNRLKVSFYASDADYGTHGYILAQNKEKGVNKFSPVRFCFIGLTTPPMLDETIMQHLFNEARNQGFQVLALLSYGKTVVTEQPKSISSMLSDSRRAAENGRFKPVTKKEATHA